METRIVQYVYVPEQRETDIRTMNDILFLYRAGWFTCYLQRLTPLPEEFSDGWECYEIYQDGRAKRRGQSG